MKKIMLFLLPAILLVSCEKDYLLPSNEVPGWLKDRIAEIEKEIQSNPQSPLDICAWVRYTYEGDYYYEFINLLSSSWPHLYNHKGELINSFFEFDKYWEKKCCKQFIWKGSNYIDVIEDK